MADRAEIAFTYDTIDRILRRSLGDLADFSGANFNGDFSLTLEEAQRRKHEYVAERIGIGPGRRLLDLGCGWGALLDFARRHGAAGVGVTLSAAQARACARRGLDVRLCDARRLTRETYGTFDAVASLGAFEHFASPEDHRQGRQDDVYRALFANVAGLLPPGGRFYLQTMVFGRNMKGAETIDAEAARGSDSWYLGLLSCQFPGSFLPWGKEQIERCAAPHFRLVESSSGRLDYIETIDRWGEKVAAPSLRKRLLKALLVPRWITSRTFRLGYASGVNANQECFRRELLDHFRLVFERG